MSRTDEVTQSSVRPKNKSVKAVRTEVKRVKFEDGLAGLSERMSIAGVSPRANGIYVNEAPARRVVTRGEQRKEYERIQEERTAQETPQVAVNIDEEETPQLVCGECEEDEEARKAVGVKIPVRPSKDEVDEHMLTHLPFRSWCPHCVKGKAKGNPHNSQERH